MAPTPKTAAPAAAPGVLTPSTAKKSPRKPTITREQREQYEAGLKTLRALNPQLYAQLSVGLKIKPKGKSQSVVTAYVNALSRAAVARGKLEASPGELSEDQRTVIDLAVARHGDPEQANAAYDEAQQQNKAARAARKQTIRAEYAAAAARLQQADEEPSEEPSEEPAGGPATDEEPDDFYGDLNSESDSEDAQRA